MAACGGVGIKDTWRPEMGGCSTAVFSGFADPDRIFFLWAQRLPSMRRGAHRPC
jgi:hypothetical protein